MAKLVVEIKTNGPQSGADRVLDMVQTMFGEKIVSEYVGEETDILCDGCPHGYFNGRFYECYRNFCCWEIDAEEEEEEYEH